MAKENNTNREGFIGAQFRSNFIKERTKSAFEARVKKNDKIDHNDTSKVITNPGVILDIQNPIARREQRRVQEQREADQILVDSYNASNAVLMDQILAFDAEAGTKSELPVKTKLAEYIKGQLDKMDKADEVQGSTMSPFDIKSLVQENAKSLLHSAPESFLALGALSLAILIFNSSPKEVRSAIKKTYDKLPVGLRRGFVLIICAGILAACGAVAPTPSAEVPSPTAPTAAENSGGPGFAIEAATENSEEAPIINQDLIQIQNDLKDNSSDVLASDYAKSFEATGQLIPNSCLPFTNAITDGDETTEGLHLIELKSNKVFVNENLICGVTNGEQYIYNVNDEKGFLTAFKSTGEEKAGIPKGSGEMVHVNLPIGMISMLKGTEWGIGVNGQWQTTAEAKTINNAPSPTATNTPVNMEAGGNTPISIAPELNDAAITSLTNQFRKTGEMSASKEQEKAIFGKLAERVGETGIWPANLTKEQNIGVIDGINRQNIEKTQQFGQDQLIYYVEINPDTKQLNILINGELLPIAGSENISIEQWQTPITRDNIDQKIANGEFVPPTGRNFLGLKDARGFLTDFPFDSAFNLVVTLPADKGSTLFTFDNNDAASGSFRVVLFPVLKLESVKDESGKTVSFLKISFEALSNKDSLKVLKGGSDKKTDAFAGGEFSYVGNLRPLEAYYLTLTENPFKDANPLFNQAINGEKSLVSPKSSFESLTKQDDGLFDSRIEVFGTIGGPPIIAMND